MSPPPPRACVATNARGRRLMDLASRQGTVKNVSVIKLSSHPGGEFTCCVCSQPLSPLHCYLYRRTVKNVSTIRDISTSHPSNESTAAAESEELLMQ
ncbi:hypothetical protein RRG08_017728 [Elysia crispata]|uniref:Uncharacterized protein n=1 Tax=Elysia crispata TaxID=231223 RepID=A0AAE0XR63_9GAST|nr:hypothetical protein RRG08_017728 [Elysia crispata]